MKILNIVLFVKQNFIIEWVLIVILLLKMVRRISVLHASNKHDNI